MSSEKIEIIKNGFVDSEGDVRPLADLSDDMEFVQFPSKDYSVTYAVRGLACSVRKNHRGGRSNPEISGREIGTAIDNAVSDAEQSLGRELTDEEVLDVSRRAELRARGKI